MVSVDSPESCTCGGLAPGDKSLTSIYSIITNAEEDNSELKKLMKLAPQHGRRQARQEVHAGHQPAHVPDPPWRCRGERYQRPGTLEGCGHPRMAPRQQYEQSISSRMLNGTLRPRVTPAEGRERIGEGTNFVITPETFFAEGRENFIRQALIMLINGARLESPRAA